MKKHNGTPQIEAGESAFFIPRNTGSIVRAACDRFFTARGLRAESWRSYPAPRRGKGSRGGQK